MVQVWQLVRFGRMECIDNVTGRLSGHETGSTHFLRLCL